MMRQLNERLRNLVIGQKPSRSSGEGPKLGYEIRSVEIRTGREHGEPVEDDVT